MRNSSVALLFGACGLSPHLWALHSNVSIHVRVGETLWECGWAGWRFATPILNIFPFSKGDSSCRQLWAPKNHIFYLPMVNGQPYTFIFTVFRDQTNPSRHLSLILYLFILTMVRVSSIFCLMKHNEWTVTHAFEFRTSKLIKRRVEAIPVCACLDWDVRL